MRELRTYSGLLWACLFLLMAAGSVRAQNEPILGSNSQVADLDDPFAFGLNPALGEMAPSRLAAGWQVLHLGLLDNSSALSTGGLVFTTRLLGGGLSLDAGYLDTPLWSLKRFRTGYGRRVVAGLSLGVSAGLDQRSFDLSDADLSAGSYLDPLLNGGLNRTVGTMALAAAYNLPLQGLTVGGVLENPHEPNISLDSYDNVVLPTTWRAGVHLERQLFALDAGLVDQEWRTTHAVGLRGRLLGDNSLLARLETDRWLVGARVAVGARAWLEYTYTEPRSELADLTSGSHGLVLCWRTGGGTHPAGRYRHDRLPDHPYDPDLPAAGQAVLPQPVSIPLEPVVPTSTFFTVAAEQDTALIKTKRLRRIFAPGVDMAQVRRLPRWRIGVLDSTWSDQVTWDITAGMTEAFPENPLPGGHYSESYRAGIDSLGRHLDAGRLQDLVIAAEADQLERARYLARQLDADLGSGRVVIKQLRPLDDPALRRRLLSPVGNDSIPAREELTLDQTAAIGIRLQHWGDTAGIRAWSVEILDSGDRSVRRLGGRGAPPARVVWDGRDEAGRKVDVDEYSYHLLWRDAAGMPHRTPARHILVTRKVMQRTLEFGVERTPVRDGPRRRPTLILDPGRQGLAGGEADNQTGGSE